MPDETFNDCKAADAIFLGAMGIPEVRLPDGTEVQPEIVLRLRFSLDLYAGVRPVIVHPERNPLLRPNPVRLPASSRPLSTSAWSRS